MTTPSLLLEVFTLESVLMEVPNGSKEMILDSLVSHAISAKVLPKGRKDQVLEMLAEREERGSTAFGKGIAVPHARVPGLKKPAGIVARSSEGVDFRAIDGEPVHAFLLLISPENRADEHLETLRWISQSVRDPDFVSFVRQAQTPEAVLDVLQERAT